MKRFYFQKLVRDRIVENCETDPKVLRTLWRPLDEHEYRRELVRKITEEANKIPLAGDNRSEMIDEFAALVTVVGALGDSLGIREAEVQSAATNKSAKKGAFAKRHYIEHVDLADDSEWVAKLREQPDKYAETDGHDLVATPGTYRHVKSGKQYEVLGLALHAESEESLVVYKPLYDSEHALFVRPLGVFMGSVEIDGVRMPRFQKIASGDV